MELGGCARKEGTQLRVAGKSGIVRRETEVKKAKSVLMYSISSNRAGLTKVRQARLL